MDQYLPPLESVQTEMAVKLLEELVVWLRGRAADELGGDTHHAAVSAVHKALIETRRYLRDRQNGGNRDAPVEGKLSDLWSRAGQLMYPLDQSLGNLCYVKGHGWADDKVWSKKQYRKLPITLDEILSQVMKIKPPQLPQPEVPKWFPVAGVVFAAVSIASLFYLLVGPTVIEPSRRIIFDVWIALCVAASAAFLGGTAFAKGQLPIPNWLGGTPAEFSVRGGFGIFIITFLVIYAAHH